MNLILLEPGEVDARGRVTLAGARADHLRRVLGVAEGRSIRVGLVDGPRGTATVTTLSDTGISLTCAFESTPSPRPRLDVLLALPRPKVMRRLWAQLSALGVGQIILTNAERVERDYFDAHVLRPEVFRPLLVEGLQQACDTRMPAVSIHRRFRILVEDDLDEFFGEGLRLVADPSADTPVSALVRAHVAEHPGSRILMAIGPEGGWNQFELDLLAAHGFQLAGMGPRPLRTDTACIALLSLVNEAAMPYA